MSNEYNDGYDDAPEQIDDGFCMAMVILPDDESRTPRRCTNMATEVAGSLGQRFYRLCGTCNSVWPAEHRIV